MDLFSIISSITILAAVFAYFNTKFLKLPFTIGLMVMALIFTIVLLIFGSFIPDLLSEAKAVVHELDFKSLLLDVMLSFLLFAGALHTKLDLLKVNRGPILMLATLGVLISALLVGFAMYYLLILFNYPVDLIYCFLFGSLIAPTDPIAVLGILKQIGAPKNLETKIVGESLFNDGVGVVVFLVLLSIAREGLDQISAVDIATLFAEEIIGGVLLGLAFGYVAFQLMRSIDHYETEVIITIALVMGVYSLASHLHFSGPLAVVVAGLLVGNKSPKEAWSKTSQLYIDKFWELLDVFLNAILFVLIGLEMLIVELNGFYLLIGLLAIPVGLAARYIAVSGPVLIFKKHLNFAPKTAFLLTWGGLRGGISIALALSLDENMQRELFLTTTYVVVVFSIIVQGLSIGKVYQKVLASEAS
ncbi:MAG: sodium:proton antiporter [Bacteroidetes bacterium]|nr:MAG: sodium:proton antiporter [Bacteroidota bacterium]